MKVVKCNEFADGANGADAGPVQNPMSQNDQLRIRGLFSYRRQCRLGLWLFLYDHRDNASLVADDVNVAFLVFADRADRKGGVNEEGALPLILGTTSQSPDLPAAEIGEEENTLQAGYAWPAIDGPAHDGAPHFVVVFGHGRGLAFCATYPMFDFTGFAFNAAPLLETDAAFGDTPSVVFAPGTGSRLIVHLFDGDIADVGDVEIARLLVERKSPGIAQAISPDFAAIAFNLREWVAGGDGVMASRRTRHRYVEWCPTVWWGPGHDYQDR